ncbi:MAG: dihydrofolate reductase, partial [Bacteroidetes bacterium]|nr:dihydrofolate reductase [Bacteroidota bacterium]
VACTEDGGIGINNKIPWTIPQDMKHFKDITTNTHNYGFINVVIMGKNTWLSLPKKFKPLSNRINIIISTSLDNDTINGAIVVKSLDEAHNTINQFSFIESVFIIGGEGLYREALYNHRYTHIYLTLIHKHYKCDKFFPIKSLKARYKKFSEEKNDNYSFLEFIQDDSI